MTGIYIHIPFCIRKCPYCDFYSMPDNRELREKYVTALCANILSYKGQHIDADTVYFGGGTPSLLEVTQIERILSACGEAFDLHSTEITLEANPCTLNERKLSALRHAGINRLSIGIQSSQDRELEFLGRLHSFSTAEQAVVTAYKTGFDNISGDLMLGLAGQDMESLDKTLDAMTSLPLSHISAYMLKIEDGTAFDCDKVRNSVADEDTVSDMYLRTVEKLEKKGFEQYEISNFAKDGHYSRHNLKYWKCEEYLGFGTAAHSYFNDERYFCPPDINKYVTIPVQTKIITEKSPDKAEEYIMLNLRLKWGISLEKTSMLKDDDFCLNLRNKAAVFSQNGLCKICGDRVSLTAKGFLVSNEIIAQLLDS